MEQQNNAPVKRRNYLAIIGLATAAVGLLIAGIALPFHLMPHAKPAVQAPAARWSGNPEDALTLFRHNNKRRVTHSRSPPSPYISRPRRFRRRSGSEAVEEKFAQLTHAQVMIVAQRTADAATIQVKNIDVKLPLSLHQDIDSLSLGYGKASKSVPITQFIAADGAPPTGGSNFAAGTRTHPRTGEGAGDRDFGARR